MSALGVVKKILLGVLGLFAVVLLFLVVTGSFFVPGYLKYLNQYKGAKTPILVISSYYNYVRNKLILAGVNEKLLPRNVMNNAPSFLVPVDIKYTQRGDKYTYSTTAVIEQVEVNESDFVIMTLKFPSGKTADLVFFGGNTDILYNKSFLEYSNWFGQNPVPNCENQCSIFNGMRYLKAGQQISVVWVTDLTPDQALDKGVGISKMLAGSIPKIISVFY